jgi:hypothetical protein
MPCVELCVYKAVLLNVEPATTACRSSSERTIGKWVGHNAEHSRRMLVGRFRGTWDSLHYRIFCKRLFLLLLTGLETERPGRVVSTHASYSGYPGIKSRPGARLSRLSVFVVFQSPARQIPKQWAYLKLDVNVNWITVRVRLLHYFTDFMTACCSGRNTKWGAFVGTFPAADQQQNVLMSRCRHVFTFARQTLWRKQFTVHPVAPRMCSINSILWQVYLIPSVIHLFVKCSGQRYYNVKVQADSVPSEEAFRPSRPVHKHHAMKAYRGQLR